MAIYRLSAKTISRSKGQSAIAAAAYRSGEKLHDETDNRVKDYGKKSGVLHSEIVLPENAPEELKDRQTLWNQVEVCEKRKDSQLAREIQFALPREQSQAQNQELIFDYCKKEFVDRGMIADISIHDEHKGNGNKHAHVMLTTREVDENGFGLKNRDWNSKELLQHWRESWGEHVNQALEKNGHDERVDHRSSYEQSLSKMGKQSLEEYSKEDLQKLEEAKQNPHVSLAASYIEKRGEKSWQIEDRENWKTKTKAYFKTKAQEYRTKSQELIKRLSDGRRKNSGNGKDSESNAANIPKNEQHHRGAARPDPETRSAVSIESESILTRLKAKYGKPDNASLSEDKRDRRTGIETESNAGGTSEVTEQQLSNDSIQANKRDSQQLATGAEAVPPKEHQRTVDGSSREPQGSISATTDGFEDGRGTGKVASQKASPVSKEDIQKGDIPASIGIHHQQSDNSRKEGATGSGIRISGNSELPAVEQVRLKVDKPKRSRAPRKPRDPAKGKKAQRRKDIAEFMDRNENWFEKDPKAASLQLMKSHKIDGKTLERDIKANIKSRKRGQTNEGRERERKREPEGRGM